jgi:hypothetical protein
MATCEIFVDVVPAGGGGAPSILTKAWVYLRDAGTITTLRTDARGMLIARIDGGPVDEWWLYSSPFRDQLGKTVELCFSRGELPIPTAQLPSAVFTQVTLQLRARQRRGRVATGGGTLNSLRLAEAIVELPDAQIAVTDPLELTPWMLQLQPLEVNDPYYLEGLNQGQAAFKTDIDLTEKEFNPNDRTQLPANSARLTTVAAAPAPSLDAPARGFLVRGTVGAGVNKVNLSIFNAAGNKVPLYAGETLDPVDQVSAEVSTDDAPPSFAIPVFIRDGMNGDGSLDAHLGLVQIAITTEGLAAPLQDWFTVYFCAAQLALVDDGDADTPTVGRALTGADELRVVDFDPPRAATAKAAKDNARARRLHAYAIRTRVRAGDQFPKQEMPQFMAELQLIGVRRADLGRMMQHAYFRQTGGVFDPFNPTIDMELSWRRSLSLFWKARNEARYQTLPFNESADGSVVMTFDDKGNLFDPATNQPVPSTVTSPPNALRPAPVALTFPETRRLPTVQFGQQRAWGRHRNANALETLVIEMQPAIPDATLRGGDGNLELTTLDFGVSKPGQQVTDRTSMATSRATRNFPSSAQKVSDKVAARRGTSEVGQSIEGIDVTPAVWMPTFRVGGVNISQALVIQMLTDAVGKRFTGSDPLLQFAPIQFWVETALLTVVPESGGAMFTVSGPRGTFLHPNRTNGVFGVEAGMPQFGPPSGYGVCQLDPPILPPTPGAGDDRIWSYAENITAGLNLLRTAATQFLQEWRTGTHFTVVARKALSETVKAPPLIKSPEAAVAWRQIEQSQLGRAMLQRQITRQFGGGREFSFFATTGKWDIWTTAGNAFWEIHVNDKMARRMQQLGQPYTRVTYKTTPLAEAGQGTFTPASFGPGTS